MTENNLDFREIDELVAQKVMGWQKVKGKAKFLGSKVWMKRDRFVTLITPHFSTAIEDAWEVVEKMRESNFYFEATASRADSGAWPPYFVRFQKGKEKFDASSSSFTFAICLAALKAVERF